MPRARVFFGWWVALGFSVMTFISTGVRFTAGPFLKPMVADLGLDRLSFSIAISLALFLYGAFIPLIGWLLDRVGARPITIAGTVVLSVSIAATGLVTRLWHFYVIYGVILALGLAATGHVVASAVVARWFTRRRATALSMLGGASMAGMSLLVPVVMWLILTVGWRQTYGLIGLATFLVMMPIALWVVRETPESMGLAPDGVAERSAAPTRVPAGEERTDVGDAVQTPSFWQLAGALSTCGFTMSLLSAHGVPMLTDHGYPPMLAAWTLGVLGGTSVAFSMALGAVADRFGCRPVLAWIYGGRTLMMAGLFVVRDEPVTLLALAALGGATMGGTFAMTSALTADLFGRFSVGSVFGLMFFVHQTGAALGSWLGGFLFELTGGYGATWVVSCALLLAASIVSLTIEERPRVLPSPSPVSGA